MLVSAAAVLLLLLSVQSLHGSALPAASSYEFTAYRMQHYNLAQQTHGTFRASTWELKHNTAAHCFTVRKNSLYFHWFILFNMFSLKNNYSSQLLVTVG